MESFCARALQSDVFPVPGGPWSSSTRFREITDVSMWCLEKINAEVA